MHGSKLIAALESAWSDIRNEFPDVPDAVIITGTAVQGKRIVRGHFAAARWAPHPAHPPETQTLPEVFLAGELFRPTDKQGGPSFGQRVTQTLVHEAAHGRAHAAGVKDTSRGARYHNKRFLALAVEMGLTRPQAPDPTIGWSDCHLDELGRWEATVARLNEAGAPHRVGELQAASATSARSGARSSVGCACEPPRTLSVTPKQQEVGPILCGICEEAFE